MQATLDLFDFRILLSRFRGGRLFELSFREISRQSELSLLIT